MFFPRSYANPCDRLSHAGGIGSAAIIHGIIVALLAMGIGQADKINEMARPIAVRLIEAVRPEEKPPVPLPPKRQPSVPTKIQKIPVLASSAPTPSALVAPEQPPTPILEAEPVAVAAPQAESLVEARFDADYLSNPRPPYPTASRRLGEAGTVYLRVHVGVDGHAHKIELKTGSGFPRLDQSALETVAQWRFVPAKRGTTAVTSWVVVPIVFSLT